MGELVQMGSVDSESTDDAQELHELGECLDVGTIAFLELNPKSGCPMRQKTVIRGWEPESFLLVDKPNANIRRSQPCALRFMQDGVVWGFYTLISDPSPDRSDRMIALAWPKEVQHVHLRRHERLKVVIPCTVKLLDGSVIQASVQDMSYGGCCILSDARLWEGMKIWLNFTLPDGVAVEELPLLVKNRRSANGEECFLGCAFVDEKEAERSGIGMFVNRMLTFERGQAAAKALWLILSEAEEDIDLLRAAAGGLSTGIRLVNGVVDLFHQIRLQIPLVVFINAAQKNMRALDICQILRNTPGLEAVKLVVYGGHPAAQMNEKMAAAGVCACLKDLSNPAALGPFFSDQ